MLKFPASHVQDLSLKTQPLHCIPYFTPQDSPSSTIQNQKAQKQRTIKNYRLTTSIYLSNVFYKSKLVCKHVPPSLSDAKQLSQSLKLLLLARPLTRNLGPTRTPSMRQIRRTRPRNLDIRNLTPGTRSPSEKKVCNRPAFTYPWRRQRFSVLVPPSNPTSRKRQLIIRILKPGTGTNACRRRHLIN